MFAISLLSLFGYHVYLISQNRTTLEAFRPPVFTHGGSNRKGFFLGKINNFREVLGDQPALWFVPIFTRYGFKYDARLSRRSLQRNFLGRAKNFRIYVTFYAEFDSKC